MEHGAGLETSFYRNDNGKTIWYEVDLPNVIEYRKEILKQNERHCFAKCRTMHTLTKTVSLLLQKLL